MASVRRSIPKQLLCAVGFLGISAGVPCAGEDAGGANATVRVGLLGRPASSARTSLFSSSAGLG
jgi:hypothetical protein